MDNEAVGRFLAWQGVRAVEDTGMEGLTDCPTSNSTGKIQIFFLAANISVVQCGMRELLLDLLPSLFTVGTEFQHGCGFMLLLFLMFMERTSRQGCQNGVQDGDQHWVSLLFLDDCEGMGVRLTKG